MDDVKFGSVKKLWLLLLQLPPFGEDGVVKQISKISLLSQKNSFYHRKEASNVWPSMPKLPHNKQEFEL
jgi:hypothetical protein